MKAIVVRRPGGLDAMSLETVSDPVPDEKDVVVQVEACGVCMHDIAVRNGTLKAGVQMPCILGHEISGTVVAVVSEQEKPLAIRGGQVPPQVGGRDLGQAWARGGTGFCREGMRHVPVVRSAGVARDPGSAKRRPVEQALDRAHGSFDPSRS